MNKKFPTLTVLMVLALIPFLSCKKIIDWKNVSTKPPVVGCDVAEYHMPYYDQDSISFPVLFKKKYDPSSKAVTEIDGSFWNIIFYTQLRHYELILEYKGSNLFLLSKNNLADTAMKVHFNSKGRVESLVGTASLTDFKENIRSNNFFYANNRLAAVETIFTNAEGEITSRFDSIHYDSYGNILSYQENSYKYDYTKKPSQQFYVDDFMQFNNGYYLLQYLGYFPEVTNPSHVRIRVETVVFKVDLTNHTFDADNRLTSYQFGNIGKSTITYNCNQPGKSGH